MLSPSGRDDHLLLAPRDREPSLRVDRPDVARVQPPILEQSAFGVVVTRRDVVAAHQDLPVRRDPHLDAGDRLPDRSPPRMERMIQRHDRRRLGQPVPLNDDESQSRPEFFELRIERRRPHHEAPELPSEQPVHSAIPPPAHQPVRLIRARAPRLGRDLQNILPHRFQNSRHRNQHRNAPLANLPGDLPRIVAVDEHGHARQHRRNERRHRLPEHVTQRKQIQEPDRRERPHVLEIFADLALDRHDVGQDVAMRDDDALRLGGRARGEQDFGDIVARDRRARAGAGSPVHCNPASGQTGMSSGAATSSPASNTRAFTTP